MRAQVIAVLTGKTIPFGPKGELSAYRKVPADSNLAIGYLGVAGGPALPRRAGQGDTAIRVRTLCAVAPRASASGYGAASIGRFRREHCQYRDGRNHRLYRRSIPAGNSTGRSESGSSTLLETRAPFRGSSYGRSGNQERAQWLVLPGAGAGRGRWRRRDRSDGQTASGVACGARV